MRERPRHARHGDDAHRRAGVLLQHDTVRARVVTEQRAEHRRAGARLELDRLTDSTGNQYRRRHGELLCNDTTRDPCAAFRKTAGQVAKRSNRNSSHTCARIFFTKSRTESKNGQIFEGFDIVLFRVAFCVFASGAAERMLRSCWSIARDAANRMHTAAFTDRCANKNASLKNRKSLAAFAFVFRSRCARCRRVWHRSVVCVDSLK
jgi:hypothetical protein